MIYPYGAHRAGDARAIYAYRRAENPDMPAARAWSWAKHDAAIDRLGDRMDVEYQPSTFEGDAVVVITLDALEPFDRSVLLDAPDDRARLEILIYVDDEPYDAGDVELTDDDRENLTVIGLSARIAGEEDPLACKWSDGRGNISYGNVTFWGYAYDSRTTDAEREALSAAIESGWLELARVEITERAYWEARDVCTVETVG